MSDTTIKVIVTFNAETNDLNVASNVPDLVAQSVLLQAWQQLLAKQIRGEVLKEAPRVTNAGGMDLSRLPRIDPRKL